MKNNKLVAAIVLGLISGSCSAPKEATKDTASVWVNKEKIQGKTFHKIFFVVMTADIQARAKLENELAATAKSRGVEAVKSSDVMAFSLKDPKAPEKSEVVNQVKASGCDAVFVASLLKKDEAIHFKPGGTTYATGPAFALVGNYYGYYSNWYPAVSTSDYYSNEKSYFMQSNLFDVASEEIMWSAKSEIFNPESLEDFSKSYVSTLLKQLEKEGLLRK